MNCQSISIGNHHSGHYITLHYIKTFQPDVGNREHIQQYNLMFSFFFFCNALFNFIFFPVFLKKLCLLVDYFSPFVSVSNKLLKSILFTIFSIKIKLVQVVLEPFSETFFGPSLFVISLQDFSIQDQVWNAISPMQAM